MLIVKSQITFDGEAEEALNFYCKIFKGKIENLLRYGDVKDYPAIASMDEKQKQLIMNARLDFGNNMLSVCDSMPGDELTVGNNIIMDAVTDNAEEAKHIFTSLSEGGKVIMPLQEIFFSPNFGVLIDKFGIGWNVMQTDELDA